MKEICLEIIAHKALILSFNLTQCAQISYQGDEEKEREGDGSYSHRWGGETCMSASVSLGEHYIPFPLFWKEKQCPESFFTYVVLL